MTSESGPGRVPSVARTHSESLAGSSNLNRITGGGSESQSTTGRLLVTSSSSLSLIMIAALASRPDHHSKVYHHRGRREFHQKIYTLVRAKTVKTKIWPI